MVAVFLVVFSAAAQGDPPITPPTDPSYIPDPTGTYETPAYHALKASALRDIKRQIRAYRATDCHWQTLMGQRCARTSQLVYQTRSAAYANWVLKLAKTRSRHDHAIAKRWMLRQIKQYQAEVSRWSELLGIGLLQRQLLDSPNIELRFNRARRERNELAARWHASFLLNAFLCIHHYEGAWDANTGNGYYGGLQMDVRFQSTYGREFVRRWGTADNWPAWAQIQASARAYRSGRGFGPWPKTARACGLL